MIARRGFLALAAAATPLAAAEPNAITIDPTPQFDISPHLYMQFMEPLGITDSSVEAAWDYDQDDWRKDFVDTVRDLSPNVIRFGGLFSRFYHWREGVGPAANRPAMRNYAWGGKETNRVGTREFVELCRRTGAEPLYCVNFLSDGEQRYRNTPEGNRTGDAREAADWVSYANDPDHPLRRSHGSPDPFRIQLWQLGNETSYGAATFSKDDAIAHTIEFAKAMKQRDPERAWQELLELSANIEARVTELEQSIGSYDKRIGIAITEGHLSLSPHNANPILSEWLSAAYHARTFNIYQRHGARVKISTAADFQGNRWTVLAVMLPTPRGTSYLMPVAAIARLFRHHGGTQHIAVKSAPPGLDIAASRTAGKMFLHVANLEYRKAVEATFAVAGLPVQSGRVFEIAPEDLRQYVNQDQPNIFAPRESPLTATWRFPAGSVTAIELDPATG